MANAGSQSVQTEPLTSLAGAPAPTTEEELEEYLSRPTPPAIRAMADLPGDLLVLGAGGKMGLSMARMAVRASAAAGVSRRVTAVSRFSDRAAREPFEAAGIMTVAVDLLEDGALDGLPDAPNVLYLAGMKFGSASDEPSTWAMNTFLPGLVARRYPRARIVALSTANVYPFTNPARGGARESATPGPIGDYAQSCLGRERILAYHSARNGTSMTLIRLAYANALRYGVLLDIALSVAAGTPIDVSMGYANVIWQGDANAMILGAFGLATSPPEILNVSGPETISVRRTAHRVEEALGSDAPPTFTGTEAETALLIDSARAHALFGYPTVPLGQLVEWTAAWLKGGGRLLNKPTHFQARDGRF
jgi:nucleoside-diphosphate-sugar epimerase